MTNSIMQHLAKVFRSRSQKSLAVLKRVNGVHVKLGLVGALFSSWLMQSRPRRFLLWSRRKDLFEVIR